MNGTANNKTTQDKIADSLRDVMDETDRLFATARPEAVFAEPVAVEGRTVISAAEVMVVAGFGGGGGFGPAPAQGEGPPPDATAGGSAVGAGGGGAAYSRPVAVIIIDGNGVRVEPVVDATRLGLAALTVFGSLLFFLGRMARMARRGG
jgi:uncharacterized spore protein YtfJ